MTKEQVWTVIIGLGSASFFGFMAYVGSGVRENTRAVKDLALGLQRHDFAFERIEERFDAVVQRFDKIDATLAEHNDHFAELRVRGDRLAEQIYTLGKRLDEHLRWHAS